MVLLPKATRHHRDSIFVWLTGAVDVNLSSAIFMKMVQAQLGMMMKFQQPTVPTVPTYPRVSGRVEFT